VWDFKDFIPDSKTASPIYDLGGFSSSVKKIIGIIGDRLIFLNTNHWVCSTGRDSIEQSVVRHFFIPNDWVSLTSQLLLDVGRSGEIVFVKTAELAVIKRGLEITEKGSFNAPRKRSVRPRLEHYLDGRFQTSR
jgi:hypothetical protein